jgi:palmitoyltransferase ZDHHC9/14/18
MLKANDYQSFDHGGTGRTVVKRWQRWPGRNAFLCDGRIILGSNYYCGIGTLIAIIVPFIAWLTLVIDELPVYLLIIASVFLIFCLVSFLLAAATDPGIIPRSQPGETAEYPIQPLDIDGKPVKFCQTCRIYRPRRAKHCKFCDNCVESKLDVYLHAIVDHVCVVLVIRI